MQILTLPISMSEEKVPGVGDQRVALTKFFTKHLENLSDQNIMAYR
jgi:hypothetical protein